MTALAAVREQPSLASALRDELVLAVGAGPRCVWCESHQVVWHSDPRWPHEVSLRCAVCGTEFVVERRLLPRGQRP